MMSRPTSPDSHHHSGRQGAPFPIYEELANVASRSRMSIRKVLVCLVAIEYSVVTDDTDTLQTHTSALVICRSHAPHRCSHLCDARHAADRLFLVLRRYFFQF